MRRTGFAIFAVGFMAATPVSAADDIDLLTFKEPALKRYRVAQPGPRLLSAVRSDGWLAVTTDDTSALPFELGSRLVLRVTTPADLPALLAGSAARVQRQVAPGLFLLETGDPWTAAREAQRLSNLPGVELCHPEMKRPVKLHHAYAPEPDDPYFKQQWHLENREANGARKGVDLNVRAAWPHRTGGTVSVAVTDVGVDLDHPELLVAVNGMPHYNFYANITNAGPYTTGFAGAHGTAVAGLIAAAGGNGLGVTGVAPGARIASWVIFDFNAVAGEGQLADMFQFQNDTVPVQNHSWSFSNFQQLGPGALEEVAISNAVHLGRGGKGVIMVRSVGNDRIAMVNANDDGYSKNPLVIGVAAVRQDGEVTSYSNPGVCILVAAPSGDTSAGFSNVFTTDLVGTAGANATPVPGANDYATFSGTSAAAPQIAGLAALLLEVNPALTYRDVQQVLINAARPSDPADPLMQTNQAGYRVNPNTGFGVPDAGRALRLAAAWPLRPALTSLVFTNAVTNQIPNQGLRIEAFGPNLPLNLASIIATPGVGRHPEDLTPFLPLVDVGWATDAITDDLTNKVALIRRGTNSFMEKINHAAAAGARLAIIANNPGSNSFVIMNGTHRAAIPAVFIRGDDGVALREYVATNEFSQARSLLFSTTYTNHVGTPLLIEHVGVRVKTDHSFRGDLRITVTSPAGTRSLLQPVNDDFSAGPVDWTYWSTHHFYESSQGVWTIQISDENRPNFGNCLFSELILRGVGITDQDADGLDDAWEITHFQNLLARPAEDADDDGESNMAEFVQGSDPLTAPGPFVATLTPWSADYFRLGWPANLNRHYQVLGTTNVIDAFPILTNLPGAFEYGEWFVPRAAAAEGFFLIRSTLP